jgi:SecD/SecF fusion protein
LITTISDSGRITGNFTQDEVDFLVGILRAGRLPATLKKEPISENQIGSMLGDDTINKGKRAIAISLLAVLVFVAIYYRFSGIVACMALLTNLVLILGMMVLLNAPLTLPGLAGLVLTIGMSVDANVLIFERIREEMQRGAALRMAIRNGFGRATTTIVDANVTTLITAMVLYAIGTDQIRGFAVTLILGILMSMYTAIFCSRVAFDIAERRRWITDLKMMRIVGATTLDFIGKRHIAIATSILLIVIGLVAVGIRGKISSTSTSMAACRPPWFYGIRWNRPKCAAVSKIDSMNSIGRSSFRSTPSTWKHRHRTRSTKSTQICRMSKRSKAISWRRFQNGDESLLLAYSMKFDELTEVASQRQPTETPGPAPQATGDQPSGDTAMDAAGGEEGGAAAPPAEQPEASAEPAVETPTEQEPKPDTPKADAPAPDDNSSLRNDLPSGDLLAMANVRFQEEPAKEAEPSSDSDDQPANEQPAEPANAATDQPDPAADAPETADTESETPAASSDSGSSSNDSANEGTGGRRPG